MTRDAARELARATLEDGCVLSVRLAGEADAEVLLDVVHRAFRARPVLGAQPRALSDDRSAVVDVLSRGRGYVVEADGVPVAASLVDRGAGGTPRLGRVSVVPEFRRRGIASFLVGVVLEDLAEAGEASLELLVRTEYPAIERWWVRHGFHRVGVEGNCRVMARALAVEVEVPDADAMRALGSRVASVLRAGDLVIASGDLGAGKTTFTQGLAAGLGVRGPVISPTFVLARVHPSLAGGPALVHVDAYRLGGFAELEDLDLEASLDDSVTLVEWGTGVAEGLAEDRLEVDIRRSTDPADETRWVFLTPIGSRHDRARLAAAVAPVAAHVAAHVDVAGEDA